MELLGGQMERLRPYFSFRGRAGRAHFWGVSISLGVLMFVVVLLGLLAGPVGALLMVPVLIAGMWASVAVAVRRLHDRGKAGWWLLPMYVPSLLLSALGEVASMSSPEAGAGFAALSLPFSIWMVVELGILRGTTGENRYGSDPLQPSPAAIFS